MNVKAENWGQLSDYGPVANPSVLYDYGKITLLHQGAGVRSGPIHWGTTTFTGTDPIWGLSFEWPKPLLGRQEFIFVFKFDWLPDLVLAGQNILWTRGRDGAPNGRVALSYAPAVDGPVTLSFLKDARFRPADVTDSGIRFAGGAGCLRLGPAEPVEYPTYSELAHLSRTLPEPILVNRDYFTSPLFEPDLASIDKPPYPTMDVVVLHETLEAYLPQFPSRLHAPAPEHINRIIDTLPILQANGFSGLIVYHLTDDLLEALAASSLRHFIVETCSAGEWWLSRQGVYINRERLELGLDVCNRLQKRMPDAKIYFWFAELEDREFYLFQGPLAPTTDSGQVQDDAGTFRYDDADNEFWREDALAQANRQWKADLWKKIHDPNRAVAVYQAGSPLAITRFKNAGADLTMNKAIFRGAFNITVAAARGTARAHHLPVGLDYDPWTWEFRMTHHPDEWRQGWLVYLHTGANFIYHEGTLFRRDADGRIKPTETGRRVCELARYARRHPIVGKPIVKMAAVKGVGECNDVIVPKFMPQLPFGGDPSGWVHHRFRDFNLLDLFFPHFGNVLVGNLQRFMTGTPYGPLDIVPGDIHLTDLQNYDFAFVLGSNGCDEHQLQTFTDYVRGGGSLVLALGQVRGKTLEPRRVIRSDLTELAGVTVEPATGRVTVRSAEIVHRFPDDSLVLHHRFGKGETFLFSTNTLTSLGEDRPRNILRALAEKSAFLRMDPADDWIELQANRKGQTVSLCLFNHGRVGFPSGQGSKTAPWQGTVTVDLEKLNLPVGAILKQVRNANHLTDHPFSTTNTRLSFQTTLDYFTEFVLGPPDRIDPDWFGPG